MTAINLTKITKLLSSLKLDRWKVILQEQEQSALYYTKNGDIETGLDSLRQQADITVYTRYGKELGDATFTIFSDDENELRAKVKDALVICASARKPWYPLPGKQRYEKVTLADKKILDTFKRRNPEQVTLKIWQGFTTACKKEKNVRLGGGEVHLSRSKVTVRNSEGLAGATEATSLYVECILTSYQGKREQEFLAAKTMNRLSDLAPEEFIKSSAGIARDILDAETFDKVQEGKLLLSGDAVRDFWAPELGFSPVVFHAGARTKHMKLSRYELEKQVSTNKSLTIISNPALAFNPASNVFDLDGTASRKVVLVKNGVVDSFAASQRYAHYLKLPVTGGIGVVELAAGKEKISTIRTDGSIEIVAFSSFSPNSISGDFSAEIRLAYLRKGGKRIPVRAAMFSGNVFRMLDAMKLSKETVEMSRYKGPALVRFDKGGRLAGF
jgi:predicted Zn-dependent protease